MKTSSLNAIVIFSFLSLISLTVFASESREIRETIHAPSLGNNIVGTPLEQRIAVFLPPSYYTSETHYPVIYYLKGYGLTISEFSDGSFLQSMDILYEEGNADEMIVVQVSGFNFTGGSWYVNSSVTGNWGDYITYDLVGYIDQTYRTIANSGSRAITGHSMGGSGALNLGMLHPEVFSVAYGLGAFYQEPEILTNYGTWGLFASENIIRQFIKMQKYFSEIADDEVLEQFKTYVKRLNGANKYIYSFGVAFSPDSSGSAPYINYPYSLSDDELILNEEYMENFEFGFGGIDSRVAAYKNNPLKLKSIVFNIGIQDDGLQGNRSLSKALEDAGIDHELNEFMGGHSDNLKGRFDDALVFLSGILDRDYEISVEDKDTQNFKAFKLQDNYPNPFNPSTTIRFELPSTSNVKLSIYNLSGQLVDTLLNETVQAGQHEVVWTP